MVLMKVRLNFFVLVTTFFGFLLYSHGPEGVKWMKLFHTIVATLRDQHLTAQSDKLRLDDFAKNISRRMHDRDRLPIPHLGLRLVRPCELFSDALLQSKPHVTGSKCGFVEFRIRR